MRSNLKSFKYSLKEYILLLVGNVDRSEAISLLKELAGTFRTLESTPYVLLKNPEKAGFWELHISWVPDQQEKQKLVNLTNSHWLDIVFKDDQTVFRRSKINLV